MRPALLRLVDCASSAKEPIVHDNNINNWNGICENKTKLTTSITLKWHARIRQENDKGSTNKLQNPVKSGQSLPCTPPPPKKPRNPFLQYRIRGLFFNIGGRGWGVHSDNRFELPKGTLGKGGGRRKCWGIFWDRIRTPLHRILPYAQFAVAPSS